MHEGQRRAGREDEAADGRATERRILSGSDRHWQHADELQRGLSGDRASKRGQEFTPLHRCSTPAEQ